MTFNQINRRFHLYLALILLPWSLMYGISSIQLAHRGFLDSFYGDGIPHWAELSDRPYNRPVPESMSDEELRLLCTQIAENLWVASGLYMWWQLKQTRHWGFIALVSGIVSFIAFILAL